MQQATAARKTSNAPRSRSAGTHSVTSSASPTAPTVTSQLKAFGRGGHVSSASSKRTPAPVSRPITALRLPPPVFRSRAHRVYIHSEGDGVHHRGDRGRPRKVKACERGEFVGAA